jgi:hypothetical protein
MDFAMEIGKYYYGNIKRFSILRRKWKASGHLFSNWSNTSYGNYGVKIEWKMCGPLIWI